MEFLQIAGFVLALMVAFFLGGAYGWDLRERHAKKTLDAFAKKVEEAIEKESKNVTHIVIEKHEDVFFVYSKENHTFMAQGKTPKEVEDALRARYPEKKFACDKETLLEMGFIS